MVKQEVASLGPAPHDLGSADMSPCRANGAPGFPPLSLFFPFSFICPLTVSSLNLINLSEGALGKHDTRRWRDC